jgi:hypothetical protein
MQPQRTPNGAKQFSLWIKDSHHHAPVELALSRAVPVNGAAEKIPVWPEKPACGRVLIRKRVIDKQVSLVRIYFGYKRGTG